ncbi:hypothetical protein [Thermomonospora umbrina]|uniref:Histidine kinase-like protein n=1 Tax=Thermomonospora umbrina TaxID=111806 RepID=A0A3D9SNA0_9ACTN|nr:hypothetical protein [Thermomonospora umbrina]REE97338.1 hypothetical protein DFJ69_2805 [Thermomonospora umbrina]
MTSVFTHGRADTAEGTAVRIGRWELPSGRAAAAQARRTVRNTLDRWGLGPAAGDLIQHLTPLVQQLATRAAARGGVPIGLRLELRPSDRLLLGEVHTAGDPAEPDDPSPADKVDRGLIALTYGRRPARDGTAVWYTHAFTWWQPGVVIADR